MITGGAIKDFSDINLKQILEKKIRLPVSLENDVNCVALVKLRLGSGKEKKHFIFVSVGTAIGGAIVINSQLFKDANFNAGKFGYLIIDSINNNNTRLSSLSLNGSVGHGIVDKYEESTSKKDLDSEEISAKIVNSFYHLLAKGIFNLTTSFDPEVVLVGDAISKDKNFIIRLQKEMDKLKNGHRDMRTVKIAKVKACHFLNDAGIKSFSISCC